MVNLSMLELSEINENLKVSDITDIILKDSYVPKTKYTILFLYEQTDQTCKDFLVSYGGKLHTKTSANINILTYYSEEMTSDWYVYDRNTLGFNAAFEQSNALRFIISDLSRYYNIEQLPALVVVENKTDGDEEKYFTKTLCDINKDMMYQTFKNVIDTFDDHCEDDLDTISRFIPGIDSLRRLRPLSLDEYLNELIQRYKEKYGTYSFDNLASDLNMSVKSLYNKRTKNKFTRDECFAIQRALKLTAKELKELLRLNGLKSIELDEFSKLEQF